MQQLADALHDEETSAANNRPNEREASTTATIMRSATLHAQDVRRLGFTIKQVVSDYEDVCKALAGLATNMGAAVTTAEFHTLDRCLDRAIAGAVSAWDREAAHEAAPENVIDAVRKVERPGLFVVDRDPHVRRLMQHFVGDAYAVEFFDDGCSALDGARNAPPSVVITEILIPRLDGLALCRLLKGDPITEHVAILVFSMLAANERAREAGADAFLDKPLEKTRVVASLHDVTDSRRRRADRPSQVQLAS